MQVPTPARADDDINSVLRRIEELNRAIQVSRQSADRYRFASQQYQSAMAAAAERIQQLMAKQQTLEGEADQLQTEIAIAEEQLAITTLQLNEAVAYVASLNAALDEGTKLLAQRQELYGRHLRQMYRQAQVSPLEMLLTSSSIADFAQRVQFMTLILRQDQQLAADIRRLRESNADKKVTAEMKQQEIEGLKAQLVSQRDLLNEQKAHLEELIGETADARSLSEGERQTAALNAQYAQSAAQSAQLQAASLERQKLQAESLYAQLAARLQGGSGLTRPWVGKFAMWPLLGPITSYFGPRWGGFHNGLDIAAPMYTPIRAASPGIVQAAGKPYLSIGDTAEIVIIAHASNMSTLYGHLDDAVRPPPVRAGQFVQAGQIIGYVGMTGWTTGPHLHFTVIYSGRPVDPLGFLP